ncbi:hypothetical protein ACJMK2_027531 [Sinanodonta woodiana]|uniref:Uncharacterized protein n=1 Tax=Sinanodonta woodiana TaxID=1069815 RepID=A0ABD3XND2_SINWO
MLDAYNKEEAEYNNAVKNSEQLKTNMKGLQEEIEQQNKIIQQLQEVVKFNNETISSLKKIKNLSIFDQIKVDLYKDDLDLGKTKDGVKDTILVENKNLDKVKDNTKFDSNWDPQFPE